MAEKRKNEALEENSKKAKVELFHNSNISYTLDDGLKKEFKLRVITIKSSKDEVVQFINEINPIVAQKWSELPNDQAKSFLFPFFCNFIHFQILVNFLANKDINIFSLKSEYDVAFDEYKTTFSSRSNKNYNARNKLYLELLGDYEKIQKYYIDTFFEFPSKNEFSFSVDPYIWNKHSNFKFTNYHTSNAWMQIETADLKFDYFYPLPLKYFSNFNLNHENGFIWQIGHESKLSRRCYGIRIFKSNEDEEIFPSKITLNFGTNINPSIPQMKVWLISIIDFKNTMFHLRSRTEKVVEQCIGSMGGTWTMEVPWYYAYIKLVEKSENFLAKIKDLHYNDYLTYNNFAKAKNLPMIKSFKEPCNTTEAYLTAQIFRSDKFYIAYIPEDNDKPSFLEMLEMLNIRSDAHLSVKAIKMDISHDNFDFCFKQYNVKTILTDYKDLDDFALSERCIESKWSPITKIPLDFLTIKKRTYTWGAIFLKPTAFDPLIMDLTFKLLSNFEVVKITKFHWTGKTIRVGEKDLSFADHVYPDCTTRPYGSDWMSYLGTTDCFAVKIKLPNVYEPFAFIRDLVVTYRKETGVTWTRNAAHCPDDALAFEKNMHEFNEYYEL